MRIAPAHDPVVVTLTIAASLLGGSIVIAPALSNTSAALSIMPLWGLLLWGLIFLGGGAALAYGAVASRGDWESAGSTLQGGAYGSAAFVTVFSDKIPPSALGIAFLVAISTGFLWRGYLLRRGG